jgi:hypothetical protein
MRKTTSVREVPVPSRTAVLPYPQEWLDTPAAELLSNLGKSRLYELATEGEIQSFCLKANKNSQRGRRLWSRSSIVSYLNKKAAEEGIVI